MQERDIFTWSVDIDQIFGPVTVVAQVCRRPVRLIIERLLSTYIGGAGFAEGDR